MLGSESSVCSVWKKISYLLVLPHSSRSHEVPDSVFVSPPQVCGLCLPALYWSDFQFKPWYAWVYIVFGHILVDVCVFCRRFPALSTGSTVCLMCVATVRGPVVSCPSNSSWFFPPSCSYSSYFFSSLCFCHIFCPLYAVATEDPIV